MIVPVLIVAVLAAAFWYGGGAPGLQGWNVADNNTTLSGQPTLRRRTQELIPGIPEKLFPKKRAARRTGRRKRRKRNSRTCQNRALKRKIPAGNADGSDFPG